VLRLLRKPKSPCTVVTPVRDTTKLLCGRPFLVRGTQGAARAMRQPLRLPHHPFVATEALPQTTTVGNPVRIKDVSNCPNWRSREVAVPLIVVRHQSTMHSNQLHCWRHGVHLPRIWTRYYAFGVAKLAIALASGTPTHCTSVTRVPGTITMVLPVVEFSGYLGRCLQSQLLWCF
jgi:hypothetical protein